MSNIEVTAGGRIVIDFIPLFLGKDFSSSNWFFHFLLFSPLPSELSIL
jgi:hypothetical protein